MKKKSLEWFNHSVWILSIQIEDYEPLNLLEILFKNDFDFGERAL